MNKITKKFKNAARKTTVAVFDFKKNVAEAYAMFPQIERSVFFVDVKADKLVHSDPAIRQELLAAINQDDEVRAKLNLEIKNHQRSKSSSCMQVDTGAGKVFFLLLYLEKDMQSAFNRTHQLDQNQHLVFDHELAHAVISSAHGGDVKSESIADSYAAARHYQRYGIKTQTIETLMMRRTALCFFNEDPDHFTSPVLEKMIKLKNKIDFKRLNPAETVALAVRVARKNRVKPKTLASLSRQFKKVSKIPLGGEALVKEFARMTLAQRTTETAKWSAQALQAFLDKKIFINDGGKRVSFETKSWQSIRHRLTEKQKAFS